MKSKSGITLIMLSITIAVMTILASTAIMVLDDTDVINKAKGTTDDANLHQVEEVVKVAWNSANSKFNPTLEDLEDAVEKAILRNK